MRTSVVEPLTAAVVFLLLAVAGCADGKDAGTSTSKAARSKAKAVWPAPPDAMERAVEAGLKPEVKEFMNNHVHAHLDVFVDGGLIVVPAGIGINIDDPHVRRFPEDDGSIGYGGIRKCSKPCISPLHTHDALGTIHTESPDSKANTLGEFFTEWGVELSETCVKDYCTPTKPIAFYINGKAYTKDPRAIELADHDEIAVVIGTPPPQIPETADF